MQLLIFSTLPATYIWIQQALLNKSPVTVSWGKEKFIRGFCVQLFRRLVTISSKIFSSMKKYSCISYMYITSYTVYHTWE